MPHVLKDCFSILARSSERLGYFTTLYGGLYVLILISGPLVLVAVLYEIVGIFIAWCVKQIFWVPHRFRYGILVAGGWGNVGDIRQYDLLVNSRLHFLPFLLFQQHPWS